MDIEKLATSAVEAAIGKTDRLSSFINSGDKEPVWDGNIYIHQDKQKTKINIKKVGITPFGKPFNVILRTMGKSRKNMYLRNISN